MKDLIIFILSLIICGHSFAQEIDKLVLMTQEADEPPTKQGQPQYSITFTKNNKGELESKSFSINQQRKKLQNRIIIEKSRIDTFTEWTKNNKKTFQLSEFGTNYDTLKLKQKYSLKEFKLDFPNTLIIKTDSFDFCQNYNPKTVLSSGGYSIYIKVIDNRKNEKKIEFNSHDYLFGNFSLNDYLYFYQLLNNCIPEEFPNRNFFSHNTLIDNILNYQQTVECEGFYYERFKEENTDRTPRENRMMIDWDFKEYYKKIRPADNNGEHP